MVVGMFPDVLPPMHVLATCPSKAMSHWMPHLLADRSSSSPPQTLITNVGAAGLVGHKSVMLRGKDTLKARSANNASDRSYKRKDRTFMKLFLYL